MADTTNDRYPVQQAKQVISDRFADGWRLLEMKGVWVDEDGTVRADEAPTFEGGPDGVTSMDDLTPVLEEWPQDDAFCVELVMARDA